MLQFLPMLMKGVQGAGGQTGGQAAGGMNNSFFKALGANNMGQPASSGSKNIGMQYANMGLTAPEVPNMMNMVGQMGQQNQQQQRQPLQTGQINPLLQMLMGGGR